MTREASRDYEGRQASVSPQTMAFLRLSEAGRRSLWQSLQWPQQRLCAAGPSIHCGRLQEGPVSHPSLGEARHKGRRRPFRRRSGTRCCSASVVTCALRASRTGGAEWRRRAACACSAAPCRRRRRVIICAGGLRTTVRPTRAPLRQRGSSGALSVLVDHRAPDRPCVRLHVLGYRYGLSAVLGPCKWPRLRC